LGLLGAILLLLLGSVPIIGGIAPSGLVGWASQMGLQESVTANAGALAGSITLIITLLITALAVFEVQEV